MQVHPTWGQSSKSVVLDVSDVCAARTVKTENFDSHTGVTVVPRTDVITRQIALKKY